MRLFIGFFLAALLACAQSPRPDFLNHGHPVLDAHNCYPYDGRWSNRIDRALGTGYPVSIEQDIAWALDPATGNGRPVVTHTPKTTGAEPTLREHFFEHVRPLVEKALGENDRAQWPLIILHFDFKSLDPALLHAVWDLLGEYQAWITTAPQTSDPHQLAPFDLKPLLVLTEDAGIQDQIFFRDLPKDARLRLFGSNPTATIDAGSRAEREHLAATLPPQKLLIGKPTNFHRWWNNSWDEVEEGGQAKSGDWTPASAARLRALTDYAHQLGYWIRFYTLDGFNPLDSTDPSKDQGWGAAYNFGSRAKAEARWKAALDAGVDLIATDQYEDLRAFMRVHSFK